MPMFKVIGRRTVHQYTEVEVEAENKDDAMERFFDLPREDRGWEDTDVHDSDYTVEEG